ncbi:hypothetical protein [Sphingomonas sp. IC4-52]|uniref:hypothetical protein n=1 Tax=Sphingomonas sp. IC4-52 TaxID=2887202 RepID=UPI001D0F95B3|nr:hypothetical protein [Sphingomonas sp. IC4-52]MCC2980437.1 hypothetical protein [Sphingomonas sp. IC4-52]
MRHSLAPVALLAPALLTLGVSGCVAPPANAPAPPPPPPVAVLPPPPVAAPLAGDWRDWPLTTGTWRYVRDTRGSQAAFGQSGSEAVLVLRCDAATRGMLLSRPSQSQQPLTVRTSSATRALSVRPASGAATGAEASLPGRDPLLDAMAFSRGRFVVEQAGAATLVVPAYAEIGRVIEDCRA